MICDLQRLLYLLYIIDMTHIAILDLCQLFGQIKFGPLFIPFFSTFSTPFHLPLGALCFHAACPFQIAFLLLSPLFDPLFLRVSGFLLTLSPVQFDAI
jgi:hypothetical protein